MLRLTEPISSTCLDVVDLRGVLVGVGSMSVVAVVGDRFLPLDAVDLLERLGTMPDASWEFALLPRSSLTALLCCCDREGDGVLCEADCVLFESLADFRGW